MNVYDPNIVKLDEEFKAGLQNILGCLKNINSTKDAKCCSEWLQKLRDSSGERELRNLLLHRLISQVQMRKLEYPFNRLPTDKPLYQLYEYEDESSWCTEDSEFSTKGITMTSAEAGDYYFKYDEEDKIEGLADGRNRPQRPGHHHCDPPHESFSNRYSERRPQQLTKPHHRPICRLNSPRKTNNEIINQAIESDDQDILNRNLDKFIKRNDDNKKTAKVNEQSGCLEDYKTLLLDYKRIVNENISDLAERLDSFIETSELQKSDLKTLQVSLQETWSTKLQNLEQELLSEVGKLESQLTADRRKYETKVEQLKQVIQEKDSQISSLDSQIKMQGIVLKEKINSVRNEINKVTKEADMQYKKKYASLKKQLIKMETINRELTKQHEQNIFLTARDYEAKVQSGIIQSTEKSMEELEGKVNNLEENYKQVFKEYKRKMEEEKLNNELQNIKIDDL